MDIKPIKKNLPLKDQAYQAIKQAIYSNTLVPGTPLTEEQLSSTLSISRTPIRSALQQLVYAAESSSLAFLLQHPVGLHVDFGTYRYVLSISAPRLLNRSSSPLYPLSICFMPPTLLKDLYTADIS